MKKTSKDKPIRLLRRLTLSALISLLILLPVYTFRHEVTDIFNFSRATISYYGSRGQEVKNIQYRLAKWGYYKGKVDGIYGYLTFKAVKSFQYKNGLVVDGVAGPETLSAIGLPTGKAAAGTQQSSAGSRDADLLAHLIHAEARGEPYIGQVAVGAVVLNRTRDSRFPNTIAGVIYQPGGFDAVRDGQINLEPNKTAINAARDALNGWDPSYGCVYYYNPATATSKWIWSRPIIIRIGKHNFAK